MRHHLYRHAFCHITDGLRSIKNLFRPLVGQSCRLEIDWSEETIVYSTNDIESISQVPLDAMSVSMHQFGGIYSFTTVRGGAICICIWSRGGRRRLIVIWWHLFFLVERSFVVSPIVWLFCLMSTAKAPSNSLDDDSVCDGDKEAARRSMSFVTIFILPPPILLIGMSGECEVCELVSSTCALTRVFDCSRRPRLFVNMEARVPGLLHDG